LQARSGLAGLLLCSYAIAMPKLQVAIVTVTGFQQNCSIIFDGETKRGALVDPGGDVPVILDAIATQGVTIEKILLTHGHIDHVGGAAEIIETLKVPIEGPHIEDKFLIDSVVETGLNYGMTDVRPCTPDRWLVDGDKVEAAGFTFSVIHSPGHSPGSVVFYNAEHKFALMGDVLFKGSIGRTDLRKSNHEQLMSSLREKILPLGDDVTFLPGHGQASQIGYERRTNPFLNGRG
jgi:hydroxyacylglutathione hydrolase